MSRTSWQVPSALALLIFGARPVFVGGPPEDCRVLGNIWSLHPLDAKCTSSPGYDNQRCLLALPHVFWGLAWPH